MEEITRLVAQNMRYAGELIENYYQEKAELVFSTEEKIDATVKASRERHFVRYCGKECHAESSPIFIEILIHLERISDHCQNIAEYMADLKE